MLTSLMINLACINLPIAADITAILINFAATSARGETGRRVRLRI